MSGPPCAMILAAGLGTRMRPLTLTTPKPLIAVAGRTMFDRALDKLAAAGVARAVVNLHHLPDAMRAHCATRHGMPNLIFSDETDHLLETGGAVKRALPLLGQQPFYALNADMIWTDLAYPALRRLAEAWDDRTMDALLLLTPRATAFGYNGKGDFHLDGATPTRRGTAPTADYVFTGLQILAPRLFDHGRDGAWSLNEVYDHALDADRLGAVVHDGGWYHVGTPESIAPASARLLAEGQAGEISA